MFDRILKKRMESKIQMAARKSMAQYKAVTWKCLRTAYFVAKEDCPYTDYEALLDL